jgi:hypothetical protein
MAPDKRLKINLAMYKKIMQLKIGEALQTRVQSHHQGLGGIAHHLVDQYSCTARVTYYNSPRAASHRSSQEHLLLA